MTCVFFFFFFRSFDAACFDAGDLFQALQNIQALQNMPRQNIGQKKLRKKKKKNTQVIYLGWIVQADWVMNQGHISEIL